MTRHRLPHEMDNPLLSLHPERTTTMTTDYSTPEFPADEFPPDYNFSALYSLFVAHVALLDPNDEQGVEWLLTQARGLCRRYFVAESYVESTANEFVDRIL